MTVGRNTIAEQLASLSTGTLARPSASAESEHDAATTVYVSDVDALPSSAQEIVMYFLDVVYAPKASHQNRVLSPTRVVAATTKDLSERVAAELFTHGISQDERHDRLGDHTHGRNRRDIGPLRLSR